MSLFDDFAHDCAIIGEDGKEHGSVPAIIHIAGNGTAEVVARLGSLNVGDIIRDVPSGRLFKMTRENRVTPTYYTYDARQVSLQDKEIHCSCGKLLCRITKRGTIKVWCKKCRKEVELEVEPYEPIRVCAGKAFRP